MCTELTVWSEVMVEQLMAVLLVKKFSAFMEPAGPS
jgi:hypothetical protein